MNTRYKMKILFQYLLILGIGILSISCEKILPSSPEENEVLDGTIEGLSTTETAKFLRGDVAFARV